MKTKNTNLDSELKNRIAQHVKNTDQPKLDLTKRNRNRALSMENLLELLRKESPQFWEIVEVVGTWVWIQFEDKQPPQITSALSQMGFHWNNRRQVWQHPCGQMTESADFDPRRRYKTYFPAQRQTA
jgi:hypothetical protein